VGVQVRCRDKALVLSVEKLGTVVSKGGQAVLLYTEHVNCVVSF
jgi:hypothetical protein